MTLFKRIGIGLSLVLLATVGLVWAQVGTDFLTTTTTVGAPQIRAEGLSTNISINLVPKGTGTVQIAGAPLPSFAGGNLAVTGTLTVTGTSTFNGGIFVQPGTSGVTELVGGAVLSNSSTTTTTTLVATEQDLFNFSVPGNTLAANNQFLILDFLVRNAATANAKQTRVYFGATLIGDSTSIATNNNWFNGRCTIWRTAAATQKAICAAGNIANAAAWNTAQGGGANLSTPAETLSGAVVLRITGTDAVAAAGTNLEGVNLLWYPQGQ